MFYENSISVSLADNTKAISDLYNTDNNIWARASNKDLVQNNKLDPQVMDQILN